MADSDSTIATLQATALTARCHNAFFRQKQLKKLHDGLRQKSNDIKDAIRADTHVSGPEAATEVALALDLVKDHYISINPAQELEEEYRIANGKNANGQTEPWGVVYIEPQRRHTPLFSAIASLSPAVAAGNCVALKLENNLSALNPVLRTLLAQALESDTFAIVSSTPSQEALKMCRQVLQETEIRLSTYSQLVSPYTSKVVGIVDRTSNLASAAEHLVTARFAFGGTSPYAPDVVLVNEFVKKQFLEHVLQFVIPYLPAHDEMVLDGESLSRTSQAVGKKENSSTTEALDTLEKSSSFAAHIVTQGSNGAVVDLTNTTALPGKTRQPIFAVAAITSLEHAISLVEEDAASSSTDLLAGYYFGTPATGKYLSQFIRADISLVNHIPYRLLLGPAAPSFHAVDIDTRYTRSHFARPSPALIVPPASQTALVKVLRSGKESEKAAAMALKKATQEIKEKKRAERLAVGFFEQGIMLGLGFYGIPLVACVGTGLFFGVRAGLRRFKFA